MLIQAPKYGLRKQPHKYRQIRKGSAFICMSFTCMSYDRLIGPASAPA